jgi:hypothetical protein
MTDKELLDLALEALRSAAAELYTASSYCNTYEVLGNTNDAITAIQQALAASVQKGAIGAEYQKSPLDEKGISMPPPAAPVQEEDLYDLAVKADNGGQP